MTTIFGNIFDRLRACPVTITVTVLCVIGFAVFTPADISWLIGDSSEGELIRLPIKLIAGAFLHVSSGHLLMNLAIWGLVGYYLEPKFGSLRLAGTAAVAALAGGVPETLLVDGQFVGLSAACYGLVGMLIWDSFARGKGAGGVIIGAAFALTAGIVDSAFSYLASAQQIAYAAHIGGLMAGFFSSLGLGQSKGPNRVFRPMTDADVPAVLEIIYDHDEDDGEEAEAAFKETLADKYVMEYEGRMMGMTGFRPDPDSGQTAWLSFTYIHNFFRKNGNAYWMMLELRNVLESEGIERLFIATSDYKDEETGEDIYLPARNFYEHKLGARRELWIEDFYGEGEARYVYSLPVSDRSEATATPPEGSRARFVGVEEAAESEDAYIAEWEEMGSAYAKPQTRFDEKSLGELIDEVKSYDGNTLYVTLPDYISANHKSDLLDAGFKEIGQLSDYFSAGVAEVWWNKSID